VEEVVRAAVVTALTGPDAIEIRDVPEPEPGPGRVRIDVYYAGVVFPDVLQTRGEYQMRPDLPFSPGWEVAGVVREDAAGFRAGDRVAAMSVTGGFAETVAIDTDMVFPLPSSVPFDKGAAIPLNYLTADFALHRRARLVEGETVLVHGAAGGVGTAACQLAAAHGARVLAVVSTPDKGDVARAAGAHEVIPVDGFRDEARRLTDGRGVDVVVDPVGGDRFTDSLRSLREGGRAVAVGFTAGEIPEVKVNRLLLNNLEVVGAGWGGYVMGKPELFRKIGEAVLGLGVQPIVGERYPLERAAEALSLLENRGALGKVVLEM
jgi:NADPH2:quinone reductase